jgi:hypothetical protein
MTKKTKIKTKKIKTKKIKTKKNKKQNKTKIKTEIVNNLYRQNIVVQQGIRYHR